MNNISKTINPYIMPTAIVIAGVFIAGAVFLSNKSMAPQAVEDNHPAEQQAGDTTTNAIRAISNVDHIRGNPAAPVKIVEYSDFECPFCKRFHETMNQVMAEYGTNGRVAWVYRQFPLDQLHPVKSRTEAIASECANELGGNDAFWRFADRFFELTPSNNQTDIDTVLPQIARELGLDKDEFQSCLESDRHDAHIQADIDDAIATGGLGTPWSVVIAENGKTFSINGAQPYDVVKKLIDSILEDK